MPKIKVEIPFPKELVRKIDKDKKVVSRSQRISKTLRWPYNDAKIDSLNTGFVGLVSSESTR
jgi:hypothetical protein